MKSRQLIHKLSAIFFPALIGLGGAGISVHFFQQYGWSLFLGLPVVVSFLAAFVWSFGQHRTFGSAYGVSCLSILALGGFILIIALDGLVCLLMALPLALILALIGTALGRLIGSAVGPGGGTTVSSLLCVCFPLLVGFEHSRSPPARIREVTTSVRIGATIEDV